MTCKRGVSDFQFPVYPSQPKYFAVTSGAGRKYKNYYSYAFQYFYFASVLQDCTMWQSTDSTGIMILLGLLRETVTLTASLSHVLSLASFFMAGSNQDRNHNLILDTWNKYEAILSSSL